MVVLQIVLHCTSQRSTHLHATSAASYERRHKRRHSTPLLPAPIRGTLLLVLCACALRAACSTVARWMDEARVVLLAASAPGRPMSALPVDAGVDAPATPPQ